MPPPSLATLGIIAGSRSLPLVLAGQARRMGVQRLVAVAFENETDPELASLVDKIIWLRITAESYWCAVDGSASEPVFHLID